MVQKKRFKNQSPQHLFNITPISVTTYYTRNINDISQFKIKHIFLNFFLPSGVIKRTHLNQNIPNFGSSKIFKPFEVYVSFWKQRFQRFQRFQYLQRSQIW